MISDSLKSLVVMGVGLREPAAVWGKWVWQQTVFQGQGRQLSRKSEGAKMMKQFLWERSRGFTRGNEAWKMLTIVS